MTFALPSLEDLEKTVGELAKQKKAQTLLSCCWTHLASLCCHPDQSESECVLVRPWVPERLHVESA